MDYNIPLTVTNLQDKILDHIKLQGEKYLPWYEGSKASLINEVKDFFHKKMYNTQCVDLLVTVAALILNLNIRVFQEQKATGYINITQHINNKTDKTINLKFTHSVRSVENHCDSICKLTSTPYLAMGDISLDMNTP